MRGVAGAARVEEGEAAVVVFIARRAPEPRAVDEHGGGRAVVGAEGERDAQDKGLHEAREEHGAAQAGRARARVAAVGAEAGARVVALAARGDDLLAAVQGQEREADDGDVPRLDLYVRRRARAGVSNTGAQPASISERARGFMKGVVRGRDAVVVQGTDQACGAWSARLCVFAIVNVMLFVLIIAHITACAPTCWSTQTEHEHGPRFFSAHIMQCKYSDEAWERVLPWGLLLALVLVLVQWNQTWRILCAVLDIQAQCAQQYGVPRRGDDSLACATALMDALLVLGSLGAYLIVQYDHRWLTGAAPASCAVRPGAAPFNVTSYHGTGVALLIVAVFGSHLLTALLYQFRVFPAVRWERVDGQRTPAPGAAHAESAELLVASRYRRYAYINGEAVYVLLALAFVIAYLADGLLTAVWLEYAVLMSGVVLSIYNLFVCARLERLYLGEDGSGSPRSGARIIFGQNGRA
ncbi:MAG: hypothetical protein CMF24_08740 [Ilumatobacter sp.]|nr:hypothetical protein [Ilumatobacter sp.]